MQTIRDLLARDLSQDIEEVIKVGQQDEQTVHNEIIEYVATDSIKRQYLQVLTPISDGPSEPTEGVGVWVSGFFGSGKSSFVKNLGYILENRPLLGRPAGEVFIERLRQQSPADPLVDRIAERLDFIHSRFKSLVIMFDVQIDLAAQRPQPVAELMYTMLLRELDYADDFDVAELEIALEAEGRLADFVRLCAEMFGDRVGKVSPAESVPRTLQGVSPEEYAIWQKRVRKGAERAPRVGAILNRLDPATYPRPETWIEMTRARADVTIRTLVERTFELTARRQPGHGVVFIIDEVGAYVARSVERIENLRALVEHFGQESKVRVERRQAVAPVWVIVTSQEKLSEVVSAIGDKRVELARLNERFKTHIDMDPADIREVATKRVLVKKPEAKPVLSQLYDRMSALLKTHTRMERTSRPIDVSRDEFIQFYPYLPHFIQLSIDIVSGIRLEPGAPRHIGGSNRTVIKQAYEMLVHPRTALADAPIGTLVSLDRIYELVEGNISSEKRSDIAQIAERWGPDSWTTRTAKAITLLEYVRDLPRSEENLAALLYRQLGDDAPVSHIQAAINELQAARYIRQTENGWKMQTAQEKSWAKEREEHNPSPRARNEIIEQVLRDLFSDPGLARYRYANQRNFRVGVTWEGRALTVGDVQVPLALRLADNPDEFEAACTAGREDSRADTHRNEVIWVACLTDEIHDIVTELYRSQQMVGKYEQLRAQGKIGAEAASLAAEKTEVQRREGQLRDRLERALAGGQGFFRGAEYKHPAGNRLSEILRNVFDSTVPDLYPKLEIGAFPVKGKEAEELLKAANLSNLSSVFYASPPDGFQLVVKQGTKYVINLNAPILREIKAYLDREHSYGNKVTGRNLESHFGGIGYGWEPEVLWLALATLLRAGAIEVTYQGRRFRDHQDPQIRIPFTGTNAFRSASFAPRKAPDLQTLVKAAQQYERLTGAEVDVEESKIAQAFQQLVRTELEALQPVMATVQAQGITVPTISPEEDRTILQEYHTMLETVLNSPSDDCVNILAGEGVTFQGLRNRIAVLRKATSDEGLAFLRRARTAVQQLWPALLKRGCAAELADAVARLTGHLSSGEYYQDIAALSRVVADLEKAYRALYKDEHEKRQAVFASAFDAVKSHPAWLALFPPADDPSERQAQQGLQESLLHPLTGRNDHDLILPEGALVCAHCGATLDQIALDLAEVERLHSDVLLRVQKLSAPEEKVERVRAVEVIGAGRTLRPPEPGAEETIEQAVNAFLEPLYEHLIRLAASGVTVILE